MTLVPFNDNENLCLVGPVKLPIKQGDFQTTFQWYTWLNIDKKLSKEMVLDAITNDNLAVKQQSSVLVYGDFTNAEDAIIRMHSICHTGDIFGSQRCDCGYQLHESMKMIAEHGCGAIFYLANHEGRGIGLFSKSLAYLLQEEGYDTVEANNALGFEDDTRNYEEAISVLESLRSKPVTLITNNPKKLAALKEHGLLAHNHIPLWGGLTETNRHYLETKVKKSGHILEKELIV
ncbi:GTP cyclohydrolase II [Lysinibacillus telephonicus]